MKTLGLLLGIGMFVGLMLVSAGCCPCRGAAVEEVAVKEAPAKEAPAKAAPAKKAAMEKPAAK